MEDEGARPGDPPPPPGSDAGAIDLGRYRARRALARRLALLTALERAIGRRDVAAVWDLVDDAELVRGLPRSVRDEAIAIVHLPPRVHRAPVHLYRHQHVLAQLGDDALLAPAADPWTAGDDDPANSHDAHRTLGFPRVPSTGPDAGCRGSSGR